jgi:hypothetical protein
VNLWKLVEFWQPFFVFLQQLRVVAVNLWEVEFWLKNWAINSSFLLTDFQLPHRFYLIRYTAHQLIAAPLPQAALEATSI